MGLFGFLNKINPSKESGECVVHSIQAAEILTGAQGAYTEDLESWDTHETLMELESTVVDNWEDVKKYILENPNKVFILETEGHSWNAFSTRDGAYHHIDPNQGIYRSLRDNENYEGLYTKKYQSLFNNDDGVRDNVIIRIFWGVKSRMAKWARIPKYNL
ncbi:hypothetical protein [Piscirickettsia litoralis]|uniref:hypothetical protein n=1 Tax=Piscirickettsia litoralis TaxID=1891921 RepID=UPI001F461C10|nr:hypothetical protein [Piscirickettsia litoralis]